MIWYEVIWYDIHWHTHFLTVAITQGTSTSTGMLAWHRMAGNHKVLTRGWHIAESWGSVRRMLALSVLPSGKLLHNYGQSRCLIARLIIIWLIWPCSIAMLNYHHGNITDNPIIMGKSTLSIPIFNSFFYVYQAGYPIGNWVMGDLK